MNKVKAFLSLTGEAKTRMLEAFVYLGWARILKSFSFAKVYPMLGEPMEETSVKPQTANLKILKQISEAIHLVSPHTFWKNECLVRAIAGQKMLHRRKIESTLYLGTGKDEYGNLVAHAWLRSGNFYISGAEGMHRFIVIGTFAKRAYTMKRREGEKYV